MPSGTTKMNTKQKKQIENIKLNASAISYNVAWSGSQPYQLQREYHPCCNGYGLLRQQIFVIYFTNSVVTVLQLYCVPKPFSVAQTTNGTPFQRTYSFLLLLGVYLSQHMGTTDRFQTSREVKEIVSNFIHDKGDELSCFMS